MADEHGGGGGGEAKFFIGVVVGLILIWLFGLYRSGALFEESTPDTTVIQNEVETTDPAPVTPTPKSAPIPTPPEPRAPRPDAHYPYVTYYLDEEGNILEIVEHY